MEIVSTNTFIVQSGDRSVQNEMWNLHQKQQTTLWEGYAYKNKMPADLETVCTYATL